MPLTSSPPRPRAARALRHLLPSLALLGAAACGGGDGGGVGPGNGRTTAVVTVTPQFVLAPATNNLKIRATAVYQLAAGGTSPLGTATADVASTSTTAVPVTVDITACVNDAARAGAAAGTARCTLNVELALLSGERVVDAQSFSGIVVQGGTNAPQAVTFVEITGVRVTLADGTVVPDGGAVRAEVGTGLTLAATPLRPDGAAVGGRAVVWTSEAPAVAQINAQTGAVTPATAGQARLVATVAGRTSAVTLNVVGATPVTVASAAGATGSGRVTSAPAGVDCAVTNGAAAATGCSAPFATDREVTLTAQANQGSAFIGWTDCPAANGATCTIAAGAARNVQVRFDAARVLSVALAGNGSGRVTSAPVAGTPSAIDCATAGAAGCSAAFPLNAQVTLTATAAAGTNFAGWTGTGATACTAGSATCTVTLDQAKSVTATFNLIPVPFGVSVISSAGEYRVDMVYDVTRNGAPVSTRDRVTLVLSSAGTQPSSIGTVLADPGTQVTLTFQATTQAPPPGLPNGPGRIVSLGGVCAGTPVTGTVVTCTFTQTANASVVVNVGPP